MVQEDEVIMLVLGVWVLLFIIINYSRLKHYPSINTLITGFCFSLLGWILTVLEGFLLEKTLNLAEHFCYLASAVCVALWIYKSLANGKEID
jgi:hypothetical protein